jgi:hypothetical protein
VKDFQAVETDETPEIGKADDTDDSDETDNPREDDAEGEASHRDGGEAG